MRRWPAYSKQPTGSTSVRDECHCSARGTAVRLGSAIHPYDENTCILTAQFTRNHDRPMCQLSYCYHDLTKELETETKTTVSGLIIEIKTLASALEAKSPTPI